MIENRFPGMNPYLERRWGDVHTSLITYGRDMIQDALPGSLRARMQDRVFIEADSIERVYSPEQRGARAGSEQSPGGVAVAAAAEPILIRLPAVEVTENSIEIIDVDSGGRVVTIVEFVSRSNKAPGKGRKLYLRKRADAIKAKVSFVEIDLLRGGKPVTLAKPDVLSDEQRAPYHASVWRASDSDTIEYYPFPLRQRLPSIRIPLRATDKDVTLNLQELVNLAYRRGRYDDIDYMRPLDPPLESADAEWVGEVLRPKR